MNAAQKGFNPDYHEEAPSLAEIRELKGNVLLEFGAPTCGHCHASEAIIQNTFADLDLIHIKVADAKGKRLGRIFKVKLWPTLILLKNGEEVARVIRPLRSTDLQEITEAL